MKIELSIAESSEVIMNLFQYYIYDMSEYTKFSPNIDGTFTVDESIVQLNYRKLEKNYIWIKKCYTFTIIFEINKENKTHT